MSILIATTLVLAGFALGAATLWLVRSRKTTTKAEAMKALAAEARLVSKMPGAAEHVAEAQAQVAVEALVAAELQAALARAGGAAQS